MDAAEFEELFEKLPDDLRQEVYDFASFLLTKVERQEARVPGLHEGNIEMSEDFDDSLEDLFLTGDAVPKKTRLDSLLDALEAYGGPDPHGEFD